MPNRFEVWHFTFRLPKEVSGERAGRYVAMALKTLLRRFGIRCTAIKLRAPAESEVVERIESEEA